MGPHFGRLAGQHPAPGFAQGNPVGRIVPRRDSRSLADDLFAGMPKVRWFAFTLEAC